MTTPNNERRAAPTNLQKVQSAPASQGLAEPEAWVGEVHPAMLATIPRPAEAQARVETDTDLRWLCDHLKRQVEHGHCGEGVLERRQRASHNDRIERLLSALLSGSTPKPAGVDIDDVMVERAAYVLEQNAGADPKRLAAWVLEEALSPSNSKPARVDITEEMVERAARHDAEESAQKGEPSPWTHYNCDGLYSTEADCPDCKAFRDERLSTMRIALTAALSTATAKDGGGVDGEAD